MMFESNAVFTPNQGCSSNNQLTCFICVQPVAVVIDEDSHSVWCSLRGIFNHLNLKSSKLSSGEDDGSWTDDVVPLCEKCSRVVRKVSGLCSDLEEVKLKIKYYLSELVQLIVLETEVEMDKGNGQVADQLKRNLKEKCSNKMEEPTLRVVLSKLEMDTEAMMEIENNLLSSHQQIPKMEVEFPEDDNDDEDEDYEPEEEQGISVDDQYEASDSDSGEELDLELQREYVTNEDQSTTPKATNNFENLSKTKPNPKKLFSCSDCESSFTGKPKLVEHSMVLHPEKYFPQTSDSTTTPAIYHKMYVTHLLNTEVDYCENSKINAYKCIYCGKLFRNHKRASTQMHLIKVHQDILRRELIQLKKDKKEDEIQAIVKMPDVHNGRKPSSSGSLETNCKLKRFRKDTKSMRREYTCIMCGVRTTYPKLHQIVYHPEKNLVKFKISENMTLDTFKLYCVHLIDKYVKKIKESEQVSDENKRGIKVECPHCKKVYPKVMACRHHVITKHREILSKELIELQECMKPEELKLVNCPKVELERCRVCDAVLTKMGLITHVKRNHPEEYLKLYVHYDCDYCGKVFCTKTGLRDHPCKGRQKNSGGGCEKGRSRISRKYICGRCKRRFAGSWGLKYHSSLNHVEEIFEGLRRRREVGREEFKELCEEVMKMEEEGMEGIMCGEEGKRRYKCGYCEDRFSKRKLGVFHLLMKHKEIVEGKVRRLQEEKMEEICEKKVIKMESDELEDGDIGKQENCLDADYDM